MQFEAEIAALDEERRKTKQINKRNELFRQLKGKERGCCKWELVQRHAT